MFDYPENMTKQEALTRRADRFIEWLKRPEHSEYKDHSTTLNILRLIEIINWALQKSMPLKQWDHFRYLLLDARYIANDPFENQEDEKINYYRVMEILTTTLSQYREFINQNDISVEYSE